MDIRFDCSARLKDARRLLRDPKGFFAAMPVHGGWGDPLLTAALYGLAAGLVNLFWGLFGLRPGPLMFTPGGLGLGGLVALPVVAVLSALVTAAVFWLAAKLCGADPEFEAALRAAAACQVLAPLRAAFNLFHAASPNLGLALGLALAVFGAWLAWHALVQALGAPERKARIAAVVLAVLSLAGLFA